MVCRSQIGELQELKGNTVKEKGRQDRARKPTLKLTSVTFLPAADVERRLARVYELLLTPVGEGEPVITHTAIEGSKDEED